MKLKKLVKAALVHLASNLWNDTPESPDYKWWDRKAFVPYLRTEDAVPRKKYLDSIAFAADEFAKRGI